MSANSMLTGLESFSSTQVNDRDNDDTSQISKAAERCLNISSEWIDHCNECEHCLQVLTTILKKQKQLEKETPRIW